MIGLLYQFPTCLQRLYSHVVWRKDSSSKVVYLTFDDGPIPEVTPKVLDILKEYGVKATFFAVGDNVKKYPHIYQRILAEGHRVGNHTMHHLKGFRVSTSCYLADVQQASQFIPSNLFRPPYGRMSYFQKKAICQLGYKIYLWDVLFHDYNKTYSVEKMMRILKRYTRNGSILNFHDSIRSADRIVLLLPKLIEWLQQEGYSFQSL